MELHSLIELIQSIPFFFWILLFIILVILFSDKQLWEYEVKFDYAPGVGDGEIEIEYYKKAKGSIDIRLKLEQNYIHIPLSIVLNEESILNISEDQNNKPILQLHSAYEHAEPFEGMSIEVKHQDEVILSGNLVMG